MKQVLLISLFLSEVSQQSQQSRFVFTLIYLSEILNNRVTFHQVDCLRVHNVNIATTLDTVVYSA